MHRPLRHRQPKGAATVRVCATNYHAASRLYADPPIGAGLLDGRW